MEVNIADLMALSKSKKIEQESIDAFKARYSKREKEFESRSKRQEVSEQFLARSYNL